MNARLEAEAFVEVLLENYVFAKDVKDLKLVEADPVKTWDSFNIVGRKYGHALEEFRQNVNEEDKPAFSKVMGAMATGTKPLMVVPAKSWCLKMPKGYGIGGADRIGKTVYGHEEIKASVILDNPFLSDAENADWLFWHEQGKAKKKTQLTAKPK